METLLLNYARMLDSIVGKMKNAMEPMDPREAHAVWMRFPDTVKAIIPAPVLPAWSNNMLVPGNEGEQGVSKFHRNMYGLGGGKRRRRQTKRQRSQRQK
jgi:hypothetical protein